MTGKLRKAFDEASKLSDKEQDDLARFLLEEIASEQRWSDAFARSDDRLAGFAHEALDDYDSRRTKPLDPDSL